MTGLISLWKRIWQGQYDSTTELTPTEERTALLQRQKDYRVKIDRYKALVEAAQRDPGANSEHLHHPSH